MFNVSLSPVAWVLIAVAITLGAILFGIFSDRRKKAETSHYDVQRNTKRAMSNTRTTPSYNRHQAAANTRAGGRSTRSDGHTYYSDVDGGWSWDDEDRLDGRADDNWRPTPSYGSPSGDSSSSFSSSDSSGGGYDSGGFDGGDD